MDGKKALIAGAIAVGVYFFARRAFAAQSGDPVRMGPPPPDPVALNITPSSSASLPRYDDPVPVAGSASGSFDYAGGQTQGAQSAIPSYASTQTPTPRPPSPPPAPTASPKAATTAIFANKAATTLIPLMGAAPSNPTPPSPPVALSARAVYATPTAKIARVWR